VVFFVVNLPPGVIMILTWRSLESPALTDATSNAGRGAPACSWVRLGGALTRLTTIGPATAAKRIAANSSFLASSELRAGWRAMIPPNALQTTLKALGRL
jgi:hypothetical protein